MMHNSNPFQILSKAKVIIKDPQKRRLQRLESYGTKATQRTQNRNLGTLRNSKELQGTPGNSEEL